MHCPVILLYSTNHKQNIHQELNSCTLHVRSNQNGRVVNSSRSVVWLPQRLSMCSVLMAEKHLSHDGVHFQVCLKRKISNSLSTNHSSTFNLLPVSPPGEH